MREVRPADGRALGPLRAVPGLHGLPGVQERAAARWRKKSPKPPTNAVKSVARPWSCAAVASAASWPVPATRSARARKLLTKVGVACPGCGGDIVAHRTKRGRTFYGCANYPRCRFMSWSRPLPEPCPNCGDLLVAAGASARCLSARGRALAGSAVGRRSRRQERSRLGEPWSSRHGDGEAPWRGFLEMLRPRGTSLPTPCATTPPTSAPSSTSWMRKGATRSR